MNNIQPRLNILILSVVVLLAVNYLYLFSDYVRRDFLTLVTTLFFTLPLLLSSLFTKEINRVVVFLCCLMFATYLTIKVTDLTDAQPLIFFPYAFFVFIVFCISNHFINKSLIKNPL